jgi:hypothetical protein
VGVLLEEVMLDLPDVVDAETVGELDLGERILEQLVLAAAVPRTGKLVLVEESETHGLSPKSVVPTEAERSEAQWRDLFFSSYHKKRSLDFASLRSGRRGDMFQP